jgi:hypothetical protein
MNGCSAEQSCFQFLWQKELVQLGKRNLDRIEYNSKNHRPENICPQGTLGNLRTLKLAQPQLASMFPPGSSCTFPTQAGNMCPEDNVLDWCCRWRKTNLQDTLHNRRP